MEHIYSTKEKKAFYKKILTLNWIMKLAQTARLQEPIRVPVCLNPSLQSLQFPSKKIQEMDKKT